jgi:hypothetical protein
MEYLPLDKSINEVRLLTLESKDKASGSIGSESIFSCKLEHFCLGEGRLDPGWLFLSPQS